MDGRFWFSTGRASRKGRNLAGNPHCVITPEDGEEEVGHSEPIFTVEPTVVFGLIEKTFTTSAPR
jgi:hypothetical protein